MRVIKWRWWAECGDAEAGIRLCDMRHRQPISINLINCKFHLKLENPNRPVAAAPAMHRHTQPAVLCAYKFQYFGKLIMRRRGPTLAYRMRLLCCHRRRYARIHGEDKTTSRAPLGMLHSLHIQQNCKCRVIKIKNTKTKRSEHKMFIRRRMSFVRFQRAANMHTK